LNYPELHILAVLLLKLPLPLCIEIIGGGAHLQTLPRRRAAARRRDPGGVMRAAAAAQRRRRRRRDADGGGGSTRAVERRFVPAWCTEVASI